MKKRTEQYTELKSNFLIWEYTIEAGEYYEASQIYLSLANRHLKKDLEIGIKYLFDGIAEFAKKEHYEYVLALSKKLVHDVSAVDADTKPFLGIIYYIHKTNLEMTIMD